MKRARTPTRIQMEAAECGAVALAIVLEYYGHYADIELLREQMGVSRDGTSAGQIARTARACGLDVQGVKADLDALMKVRVPAVLHWEFDHFVVFEGTHGDEWFINDPAVGPRRLSRAEMDAAFTGVALLLAPGAQFKRTPPPPSMLRLAWGRLDGVHASLWVGLVASLGMVLPNMLVPTFSGVFTDRIVIQSHTEWLWALLAAMLVFGLTRTWALWQRSQQLTRAQTVVSTAGALGFLRHALRLPVDFYYHRFAAEIANRLKLNDSVAGTLVQTLGGAFIGVVCMLIYGVIMAHYDLGLTLLALLFAGISVGSLALSQRLLADAHRRVLVEEARRDGLVNRSLAGYEESSAAGTNDLVFDRVIGQYSLVVTQRQAVLRNAALLQALQRMLTTLGLVAVLVKGGYDIMDGVITVGMMVAFQGLMNLFSGPIEQLMGAGVALQDVRGNLERIDDVTSHAQDPVFDRTAVPAAAAPAAGRIEFRAVRFAYTPDRPPQLADLNLVIEAGSRVAIVGASGCGKSTLARLLVGQLTPQGGDILMDGCSVLGMAREQRFASLAHVDQEVRLFSGSMMDNLTLWDGSREPERVRTAARDAAIDDMIAQRPGEYGARVVEAGANMSGGERQRVDIARALARNAPVLVLDEATSALDPPVERVLLRNVLTRGCTLVFISHRLAPLDLFDRIVVMQAGAIVQDGRFEDLIRQDGPLRNLVDV